MIRDQNVESQTSVNLNTFLTFSVFYNFRFFSLGSLPKNRADYYQVWITEMSSIARNSSVIMNFKILFNQSTNRKDIHFTNVKCFSPWLH